MTLEALCRASSEMGIQSVELVEPEHWPVLKRCGLICAVTPSHSLERGFNDPENHSRCIEELRASIDACSDAGFPMVITFSGLRNGIPDDVGIKNTVDGLKKVLGYAEKNRVTLCLEVLNSRVDDEMKGHPGYMGDTVEWAAEVCERIASPRMTFLFDVYHVQVMQGDIISRIGRYSPYIGHYHIAGVPGRREIDETQELNYPAILKAIADTGYEGYVGHEFVPTGDPLESLRGAVALCSV
jgi:hydroxypyruvate isomerase